MRNITFDLNDHYWKVGNKFWSSKANGWVPRNDLAFVTWRQRDDKLVTEMRDNDHLHTVLTDNGFDGPNGPVGEVGLKQGLDKDRIIKYLLVRVRNLHNRLKVLEGN